MSKWSNQISRIRVSVKNLCNKTKLTTIIKNLTKCNILSTFVFKNYGFTNHNLEKLYPWSLASTISVLVQERVCSQKGGPWDCPRVFFFLSPWPWPRTLCPRLHLWFTSLQKHQIWHKFFCNISN